MLVKMSAEIKSRIVLVDLNGFLSFFKKCSILILEIRKQPQISLESMLKLRQIKVHQWTTTRGSYAHNIVKFSGALKMIVSCVQLSQNIDGFRQNNSQGF